MQHEEVQQHQQLQLLQRSLLLLQQRHALVVPQLQVRYLLQPLLLHL